MVAQLVAVVVQPAAEVAQLVAVAVQPAVVVVLWEVAPWAAVPPVVVPPVVAPWVAWVGKNARVTVICLFITEKY